MILSLRGREVLVEGLVLPSWVCLLVWDLEWHVTKLIKDLQKVVIVDYVIKAGGEEVHEVHKLAGLNAPDILKYHIDEVVLLDDASVVGIMLPEFRVQVDLQMVVHLVDLLQHCSSFKVLQNYFFLQKSSCLSSEGVLLVALERWLREVVAFVTKSLLRWLVICVVYHC